MSEDDTTSVPSEVAPATPASTTALATSPTPAAEDAPSQAQSEPSGETHTSLLEAMQSAASDSRKIVREDDGGRGASPASVAQQDQSEDADDDGNTLPDEVTAEELTNYSRAAKRRIRKLYKQRYELRTEVHRLRAIEPHAQAADSVSRYLRDNDISRDDFLLGLEVMGFLRRGELQKFRQVIEPYWNMAEQFLGNQLPPDIQNAVRQGQLTTEAAVHFTRERMQRMLLESQHQRTQNLAQQQQQQFQQQQEMQRRVALGEAVKNRVNAWERTVAQHDPQYAMKRSAVQNTMWAVVNEQGIPQSPEHGEAIAREAYRRVNEQFRSWTPPKRPTSRTPSSTGRTTGAAPEAKSLLEVIQRAREGARV